MKIDGQKTANVEKSDDAKRREQPSKKDDKKDFNELLARKKDGKTGKGAKSDAKSVVKNAAHKATEKKAPTRPANRPLAPKSKPGQASTFGKQLKDGKLQLGQQAEQHERLGSELNTARHHSQTRLEHRHRKKHHRQVRNDHAEKPQTRHGVADKQARAGSRKIVGKSAPVCAASSEAASSSVPNAGAEATGPSNTAGASKAEAAAPSDIDHRRAQVAELARKLVDRAHIGHDASGRQIMLMDLEVPGRGNVRVRLRRRGEGFELRMRPDSDELARELRHEREHFRQSAAEAGVDFTSIEIV